MGRHKNCPNLGPVASPSCVYIHNIEVNTGWFTRENATRVSSMLTLPREEVFREAVLSAMQSMDLYDSTYAYEMGMSRQDIYRFRKSTYSISYEMAATMDGYFKLHMLPDEDALIDVFNELYKEANVWYAEPALIAFDLNMSDDMVISWIKRRGQRRPIGYSKVKAICDYVKPQFSKIAKGVILRGQTRFMMPSRYDRYV